MQPEVQARYSARAKVIKALAHPTRLFMVDELSRRGKRCVCDLTDLVGADMSTVSRHLAILKNAGIIGDERHGSQIFYQVKIVGIGNLLKCVETLFQKTTQTQMHSLQN
jgi:ArsR family transcriptional regulator